MIHTAGIFLFHGKQLIIGHPYKGKFYTIPKGHVEEDETYTAAAVRETMEEFNVKVVEDELNYIGEIEFPNKQKILHAFAYKMPSSTILNLKCNSMIPIEQYNGGHPEIDKFQVVPIYKAMELLQPIQIELLQTYLYQNKWTI